MIGFPIFSSLIMKILSRNCRGDRGHLFLSRLKNLLSRNRTNILILVQTRISGSGLEQSRPVLMEAYGSYGTTRSYRLIMQTQTPRSSHSLCRILEAIVNLKSLGSMVSLLTISEMHSGTLLFRRAIIPGCLLEILTLTWSQLTSMVELSLTRHLSINFGGALMRPV